MNKAEYIKAKAGNVILFAGRRHGTPLPSEERGSISLTDYPGCTSRRYPATEETVIKVLKAYGICISSVQDLARLHEDEYHAELDVMSHVAAYFDISSKRLIDDIPQVFETVFAGDFGEKLRNSLTTNLNLIDEKGLDNCQRYIRDEPNVQAKRDHLDRLRSILENAKETIDRFFK
jgi:hypothetical protein